MEAKFVIAAEVEHRVELISLDDFYIDIPSPFKTGDLVFLERGTMLIGNVFIIRSMSYDKPRRYPRSLKDGSESKGHQIQIGRVCDE